MRLNTILDRRQAIKDKRDAAAIARSPRPMPRYPDALQSLKIHIR